MKPPRRPRKMGRATLSEPNPERDYAALHCRVLVEGGKPVYSGLESSPQPKEENQ
jgi:hypothetical protein